jgi:hypothetical protein
MFHFSRFFFFITLLSCWLAVVVSSSLRATEESRHDKDFKKSMSKRNLQSSRSTIASLIRSNSQLDTLETTLKTTGLNKTLEGKGPYTVFAPTDSVSEENSDERFCIYPSLPLTPLSHTHHHLVIIIIIIVSRLGLC